MPTRRTLLAGGLAALAAPAVAQTGHEHHAPYEALRQPGCIPLPEIANQQRVFDSPAPRAANAGRWIDRAALPLPRSEMAWAAEFRGRLHLVGGYGEQRVDRPYHHVYDPGQDSWSVLAPLPRGANHVGVAVLGDRLYAVGGFVEQNRNPHAECFAFDPAADRWTAIAPLPRPTGAIGCVALNGRLHAVGGAEGTADRRSVSTHLAYDPAADRWEHRAPS
jgi:N-acetylneuraminic acid mutarotase